MFHAPWYTLLAPKYDIFDLFTLPLGHRTGSMFNNRCLEPGGGGGKPMLEQCHRSRAVASKLVRSPLFVLHVLRSVSKHIMYTTAVVGTRNQETLRSANQADIVETCMKLDASKQLKPGKIIRNNQYEKQQTKPCHAPC